MKIIYCIVFALSFCNVCIAQTQKTKVEKKRIELKENYDSQQIKSTQKPAEESDYYGLDAKLKSIFIKDEIPTNFPTRFNFNSKNEYLIEANAWKNKNNFLVKPEFKNSIID